jgi:hypothetical protein
MNNQFNERMAIQQRNWQENMWNKENAYNTASAQRQRLEEAGLNPYLMMNGGSAGVAQSAGAGYIRNIIRASFNNRNLQSRKKARSISKSNKIIIAELSRISGKQVSLNSRTAKNT